MSEDVTIQDLLAQARIDLVELRRGCNWLHRLYWDEHLISYANYVKQCHENEELLVRLLNRIRRLESEATGGAPAEPQA